MKSIVLTVVSTFLIGRVCASQPAGDSRDPSSHRATMVTVDRDVTLEVLDWGGTGRPLVLLAGLGNTAHVFDDFAPRLAALGHVYAITRRGHGISSVPKGGYDADRLADDVLAVLDALRLERPIVIGHSVAGEELNSLAARYPLRAAGIVYIDAVGDRTAPPPPEFNTEPISVPRPTDSDRRSVEALQAWTRRVMGRVLPESEIRQTFEVAPDGSVGRTRRQPPAWVGQAINAGVKKPDYARMRDIPALSITSLPPASVAEARALNIWNPNASPDASEDAVNRTFTAVRNVTRVQTDAFKAGLKGARVVELIGADHTSFASNPDDVFREIRVFLEGLR